MSARISSLPVVVSANIADTDILPIVTGIASNTGVTKRVSITELRLKLGTTAPAGGRTVTSAATYLANNAVFNVKDFGAFGDGATNDTTAIQNAMTAATGNTLYFPPGIYKIIAEINGVSNVRILGYGATIKSLVRIRSYLYFTNKTNVHIEGLTFDLGQTVLATFSAADYAAAVYIGSSYNIAVYCDTTSDISLHKIKTTNLYTNGLVFYGCSGYLRMTSCSFTSPVQTQKINAQHVYIQTTGATITVEDCLFDNAAPPSSDYGVAGLLTSGLTGTYSMSHCTFNYCGRNSVGGHQLGAWSSYGDMAHGDVHHNQFLNCLMQVIRLTAIRHANVHHNYCTMASVADDTGDQMVSVEGTITLGVNPNLGVSDLKLHHNTFIDAYGVQRTGVLAEALDWGFPLEDVMIHNNLFQGMKYAFQLAGPYKRVNFDDNHMKGANGNTIKVDISIVGAYTATYGTQAASFMAELSIRRNMQDGSYAGNTNYIFLNYVGYTGTIGDIFVEDNSAKNSTTMTSVSFVYRGVAAKGRLFVRRNQYSNQATLVFDLANGDQLVLEDNAAKDWTGASPIALSGFTTMVQRHNRYSTGLALGINRLVAGTVVVATTEALTGDQIMLSRTSTDGSNKGHLYVSAITNKTSFAITSTDAAETNFIGWEIIH